MGKGVQIAIATLSVFAGVFWLISAQGDGEGTFQYYTSVAEFRLALAADAPGQGTEATRVHGFVVAGSISKDLRQGYVDFAIRDAELEHAERETSPAGAGGTLAVRLLGIEVPDLFRDDAEVVVEGYPEDGRFMAKRIFAKCPSKYEAEAETEI